MFPAQQHVYKTKSQREALGSRLELARLEKGLTQMEALKKAGLIQEIGEKSVSGVTKGFVTYVEKGKRGITPEQLKKLSILYGKPLSFFTDAVLPRAEYNKLLRLRAGITRGRRPKTVEPTITVPPTPPVAAVSRRGRKKQVEGVAFAASKLLETPSLSELTPGDRAILKAVEGCTEAQKQYLVDAIRNTLKRIQAQFATH